MAPQMGARHLISPELAGRDLKNPSTHPSIQLAMFMGCLIENRWAPLHPAYSAHSKRTWAYV